MTENTSSTEWNHVAVGDEKLAYSWSLCRELAKTLMPGAFILGSNGKHYPAEPIPCWKPTLQVVRCVDSSTERIKLHMTGMADFIGVRINGYPCRSATPFGRMVRRQVAHHTPLEIVFVIQGGKHLGVCHYLHPPEETE